MEAGFATNAVGSFQDLLSKISSTSEGGSLASAGPVPNSGSSQLHITQVLHGSFGFLLEEIDTSGGPLFETPLKKAADQATELIATFAGEDDRKFSEAVEELSPRVFLSLREFFRCVYRDGVTFRLVERDHDQGYSRDAIERAWRRAEESSVDQEQITADGVLLGVIPMRRRFEFQLDIDGKVIYGGVAEEFTQTYLEHINTEQYVGKRWRAVLKEQYLVTRLGRKPKRSYTLLKLEGIVSHSAPT